MPQKESRYLVIKRDGERVKFLKHEGHMHYWTTQRDEAMEYTKIDVAQALASKERGEVAQA